MKVTKKQIHKWDRKFNRDEELSMSEGWVAKHKVHHSKKTYNRKKLPKI
jgi:hypothetical protein